MSPPPPTGTSSAPRSSTASAISSPAVPCPAITSSLSYEWMNGMPCVSAYARAASWLVTGPSGSTVITSAPSARTRSSFTAVASAGMNTVAGTPSRRAARATPWPWLPLDDATTPRRSLRRIQPCDRVVGAPDLERADRLERLGLEQDRPAVGRRERDERRGERHAAEALRCRANVVDGDRAVHVAHAPRSLRNSGADASTCSPMGWYENSLFGPIADDIARVAPPGTAVLEVGCGSGALSLRLAAAPRPGGHRRGRGSGRDPARAREGGPRRERRPGQARVPRGGRRPDAIR